MKRKHWRPDQTGPETREDRIARVLAEDRDYIDVVLSPAIEAKKARFESWLRHTNLIYDDHIAPREVSDPEFMPFDPDYSLGKLTLDDRRARSELFSILDRDDRLFDVGHLATVTDITVEAIKPEDEPESELAVQRAAYLMNDIQEPPMTA